MMLDASVTAIICALAKPQTLTTGTKAFGTALSVDESVAGTDVSTP